MAITESETSVSVDRFLQRIRPAVRSQHPYLVGGVEKPPVKLNQNESPYDLPEDLKDELLDVFRTIPFNRYPEEQPGRLIRAYGQFAGCPPECILAGNGSNELTYTLGLTLLEKDTPVVLPRPMFSLYEKVVRMHDAALVEISPRDDFSFDADGVRKAVEEHDPALTVLTSPNNPTGLAMPLEEIEPILAAAAGFVVVDEAYVEFTEEESALTLLDAYPNLILLRTLSKACGLAGLRLGFMMAHASVVGEVLKARLPFMIDPLAEEAAVRLLAHPDLLRERAVRLKASCRFLASELQSIDGVRVLPSQANFILFRTPLEPSALMGRLAEGGVLVRNMGGYRELQGFLRVNAGTQDENNAFLVALKNALTENR